jgi:hypothetical protein
MDLNWPRKGLLSNQIYDQLRVEGGSSGLTRLIAAKVPQPLVTVVQRSLLINRRASPNNQVINYHYLAV